MSTASGDPIDSYPDTTTAAPAVTPDLARAVPPRWRDDAGAVGHRRRRGNGLPDGRARRPLPVSVAVVAIVAIGGMMWIGDLRSPGGAGEAPPAPMAGSAPGAAEHQARMRRAPDFSAYGFALADGQNDASGPDDAVVFSYVGKDGHRVVFYSMARSRAAGLRPVLLRAAPASLLSWSDDGTTYALAGEIDGATLLNLGAIAAAGASAETATLAAGEVTAAQTQSATVSP